MKVAIEQTPSYYEVPNRRVDGFVGREDILQKIDEALSDGSGPHYAVLQGIGGQGKTQVALEYCHRKKDNPYSAIFWVDAITQERAKESFQSISERIKTQPNYLPDINARVAFVLRKITSWTIKWLMVFDNYDNPETFPNIQDFIPRSERGAILVTSRHPGSASLVMNKSSHFLELSGLEESAAVALLIQQSQMNEAIFSDAKKIVERLGCHPLALAQAGVYIKKRNLRLCEFMDHYKRRKKIILENMPQLSQYLKRLGNAKEEISLNVFTTWELSFEQVQSKGLANDVGAKLLTLLAFFDEKDISEQLFAGYSANQDQLLESNKLLTWLNAFSSERSKWDSDFFEDVLIRLRDSSLLQAFARGLDGFCHSSLHPLIKDWIRLRIETSVSQENTYMAATIVRDILMNSVHEGYFDLPLLAKQNIKLHIIALEKSYQEFFIPQPSVLSNQKIFDEYTISQSWFARFLFNVGSYHPATVIYQRIYEQNKKNLGAEHPDTLTNMAYLASTYRSQGRWEEAEQVQVQVMKTRQRVLGLEHPDTLASMANLASAYQNQGRWEEAEELEVQVMETRKRALKLEHPDMLNSMVNLALTYRDQGRWKEAEVLDVQVVETRQRVLGLEHPDTLTSMANLASTYRNEGRWKEAEELDMRIIETSLRMVGLEHPSTLTSMSNLASTFWSQGRWKEAEALDVQVMETRKRVLELEHPDTLNSMTNLALTYRNQGRWKEAKELDVQVVETRKRVLGLEHPDTLNSMANLASTYRNEGRWKEAEELDVQVMETRKRVLGLEYPSTLTSMSNLASTFWSQGRWKEAEELDVHVMETRKRVLGLEHPDTLTSMANLASIFGRRGMKKDAIQLMSEVVQYRQKKTGSDHPDTIESMSLLDKWQNEN